MLLVCRVAEDETFNEVSRQEPNHYAKYPGIQCNQFTLLFGCCKVSPSLNKVNFIIHFYLFVLSEENEEKDERYDDVRKLKDSQILYENRYFPCQV